MNSVYTFISGRMKMKHNSKKKLEGITLQRIEIPSKEPKKRNEVKSVEEIEKEKKEYQRNIFNKMGV